MTGIKTALPVMHTPAAPSQVGGLGNLEKLPSELIQLAVDQLRNEPHALAGFAVTTKLAKEFTNQSLASLVPSTHRTTSNRLGEWTAKFRTLDSEMQKMLKATSGLLPCPDIFAPIDEDIKAVHLLTALVQRHARSGETEYMERCLAGATQAAEKIGIQISGVSSLRREGYTHRFHKYFAAAQKHAQEGNANIMETCLDWATNAAKNVGIATPDVGSLKLEGYTNSFHKYFAAAQKHAQDGRTRYEVELCLTAAAKAADKAGIKMANLVGMR